MSTALSMLAPTALSCLVFSLLRLCAVSQALTREFGERPLLDTRGACYRTDIEGDWERALLSALCTRGVLKEFEREGGVCVWGGERNACLTDGPTDWLFV